MRRCLLLTASAGFLTLLATSANALIIDDFDEPADNLNACNFGPTNFAAKNAIAGSRTLECTNMTGGAVDSGTKKAAYPVATTGVLDFDADTFATVDPSIVWDANEAGSGDVDLAEGGINDKFNFDVAFVDQTDAFDFTLEVTDFGGQGVLEGGGDIVWSFSGSSGLFTRTSPPFSAGAYEIDFATDAANVSSLVSTD